MNIINLGEVFYLSVKAQNLHYGQRVVDSLRAKVEIVSASDEFVMEASRLKAKYAISYADAFAAVTAVRRRVPLVTGDAELRVVAEKEKGLLLEWVGN